jgi:hypothetical protein
MERGFEFWDMLKSPNIKYDFIISGGGQTTKENWFESTGWALCMSMPTSYTASEVCTLGRIVGSFLLLVRTSGQAQNARILMLGCQLY